MTSAFGWELFLDLAEEAYQRGCGSVPVPTTPPAPAVAVPAEVPPKTQQPVSPAIDATKCEAEFRCSISRAYYAIFKKIEDYLIDCGELDLSGQEPSHVKTINCLTNCGLPDCFGMAIELRKLKGFRRNSDYEEVWPSDCKIDPKSAAARTLKVSKDLMKLFQKWP